MDNNSKLWIAAWASVLVLAIVLIPSILVKKFEQESALGLHSHEFLFNHPPSNFLPANPSITSHAHLEVDETGLQVTVYLSSEKRIETVPLEHYVRGVLAAEMPAEFELEALKAQAIAARTYILRRIMEEDYSHVPVAGALVTDGKAHQVYYPENTFKSLWDPITYEYNLTKLNQAVNETKGLIATYERQPINATFFSTSNGFTENSEDYWNIALPYLRSVPSPWDAEISPRYEETISIPYSTVAKKLGFSTKLTNGTTSPAFIVLEKTTGQRIKRVVIGDKTFTGREVREKLGLNSSQFQLARKGDQIEVTTYGYGHGVGMSQWGANGMALEGKTAEDIIKYYYQGVEIEKVFLNI